LPASPDLLEPPPRRPIPLWVKLSAAVVAVVLIAIGNTAAKKRQQRLDQAAADRVDATLLATGGEANDREFDVTLLVANRGERPITVQAGRRLVPPLYEVLSFEDRVLAGGASDQVSVTFRASCPAPARPPQEQLQLVIPIAAPSGRVRDVATDLDEGVMWELSRQACGYLPLSDTVLLLVRGVTWSQYTVRFTLQVHNQSARPVTLMNVTSPGLALSVRGGIPVLIPASSTMALSMAVALPACSRLPALGPPGRGGALRFGTLALELREASGPTVAVPYALGADGDAAALQTALFGLRNRICPGTGIARTGRPRSS
jgi:hypothetical protein